MKTFFFSILLTVIPLSMLGINCNSPYQQGSVNINWNNCPITITFCYYCGNDGSDYSVTNIVYSEQLGSAQSCILNPNDPDLKFWARTAINEFLVQQPNCNFYPCDDPITSEWHKKVRFSWRDCWQKVFIPVEDSTFVGYLFYEQCCNTVGGECIQIFKLCGEYSATQGFVIQSILIYSDWISEPGCPEGNPPLPNPLPDVPWVSECFHSSCE